jgi:hypothetical protein
VPEKASHVAADLVAELVTVPPVYARVDDDPYTRAGNPMHKHSSIEELMHTRKQRPYRFAAPTDDELTALKEAYHKITGRTVWPKMVKLIAVCWRMQGLETASVMRRLYAEHGVTNLLLRVKDFGQDEAASPSAPVPTPVWRPNKSLLIARHNGALHVEQPDPDCPSCATETAAS